MNAINVVLAIKIFITVAFLAGPFLLSPQAKLEKRLSISAKSPMLFRLYGVSMLALAVAYASGIWQALQGDFPWGIVWMGIVSNGGAAAVLLLVGPRNVSRAVAAVFGAIAIALLFCALMQQFALAPLF
ncbi:hypothetical protein [Minwuia sp.]|uniref:hypothetical protein n=1 Tax=Minwuia sp. TaxID=2493630 RepID=UPI003A91CF70